MQNIPESIRPEVWLLHIFSSQAAAKGGVLRRSVNDVEKIVGRGDFLREIERRGYSVIENAGQFVVFCNQEPLSVVGGRQNPSKDFGKFFKEFSKAPAKGWRKFFRR
jgi:hypothetical protein